MSKKFDTDRPTIEEILDRKKPRTRTLWITLDTDLVDQIERLERDIAAEARIDEREHRPPVAPRLRAELDALKADRDAAAVAFTFTAIPKRDYRRLLDEHPDPEGQKRWNEETFAPALIAACASDPVIPLDQAERICQEWAEAEYTQVFHAVLMVNAEETQVPFSVRGTAPIPGSGSSSTSAANGD